MFVVLACFLSSIVIAQVVEDNLKSHWNDFLHYSAIGRLDLAKAYAQTIIDSDPDPIDLLGLAEKNQKGYRLLLKINADSDELRDVSAQIIQIIEQGRFDRRTDPKIITTEIKRLSSTIRGRLAAEERLKNAGEYAVPFMLEVLSDAYRKDEYANVAKAIPNIGPTAIRPLVAALGTENVAVKGEIVRALGDIGYPHALAYLKFVAEFDQSTQLRELARKSIIKIDASVLSIPAAELFFRLGISYYDHAESLGPDSEENFANIWFWDKNQERLTTESVDKEYFNELMAMRSCEWALQADENLGKAIGLWIAAFFKAESTGLPQPQYFISRHAEAMTYATTAGPEYLHQALARAIKDNDAYVALGIVEALAANAGENSLLYRVGTEQALADALSFDDTMVRYSAAIAFGSAGPTSDFIGSNLIVQNLTEAIGEKAIDLLGQEMADAYALRSINVMKQLALARNHVVDLSKARDALVQATRDNRIDLRVLAAELLAYDSDASAQQAIAKMALSAENSRGIRVSAFESLTVSAKLNGSLLTDREIDDIYSLVSNTGTQTQLQNAAAISYGALNLPSKKIKSLILDQAVN